MKLIRFIQCSVIIVLLLFVLSVIIASWYMRKPYEIYVPPLSIESNQNFEGNVIIIGAGTAGLFCAYTLDYLNVSNYIILEASDKFGGRVQELNDFIDVPLDLGAEWIHGNPKILKDLLLYENKAETIETISYQPRSFRVYKNGRNWRRNFYSYFYREFKFKNTTWFHYLENYVAKYVEDNIIYSSPVTLVNSTDKGVVVTTSNGTEYFADKVVIATPLKTTTKYIKFQPSLPKSKLNAMNDIYVAPGMKVWIEFSDRFYPDMQAIDGSPNQVSTALYLDAVFDKPTNRNCLLYFLVTPDAYELTDLNNHDEIINVILGELDEIYHGQASQSYIQHYIQNWANVPYIEGAYAIEFTDYVKNIKKLAKPVGNLYFAGSHTSLEEVSTVHGAALSGRRAAQELLNDI